MKIGIPREIKQNEGRVALIPYAVAELTKAGHKVYIASSAGDASGYPDAAYQQVGAEVLETSQAVYESSGLIVKVKEPVADELNWLKPHHTLFSFLHLAAMPALLAKLCDIGLTAIGFETVADSGRLPLLAPMSQIAGRIAAQYGTTLLYTPNQGRGILLGGITATERGEVVVLGAGMAGSQAALTCAALGANVHVFDLNQERLQQLQARYGNISTNFAYPEQIQESVHAADLVIGAVLIPGAKAPHIVTEDNVKAMQKGSVIVDISIDQGGCIETIKPTSYAEPTYVLHDVVHFGVTNIPGAVPRTASQSLSHAILPYVQQLTSPDWLQNKQLHTGINVQNGKIVHPALQNIT